MTCADCGEPCERPRAKNEYIVHRCGVIEDGRRQQWCAHLGSHLPRRAEGADNGD